jgi:hypothetical protein
MRRKVFKNCIRSNIYIYKREFFPTELTRDEEMERGPGE